jgi:hypothetical protein
MAGRDGDGCHRGGVQVVAHRVDHGHVQDVVVEGVVEAVAGDSVGGLQDACHLNLGHGHRQRWQQAPLDLRGHAHRLPAPGQEELVGVGVLGDLHVGDQAGEHRAADAGLTELILNRFSRASGPRPFD